MQRSIWPRQRPCHDLLVVSPPQETCALLKQLEQRHLLLRVDAERSGAHFQTLLLAVDYTAGRLLLDEPFPAGSDVRPGEQVTLSAALGGTRRVSFTTELLHRDGNGWEFAMPAGPLAVQRRYASRYTSRVGSPELHSEFLSRARRYAAQIGDLSLTGIRLQLAGPFLPELVEGERLQELRFPLDGHYFVRHGSVRQAEVGDDGIMEIRCALDATGAADDVLLDRAIQRRLAASENGL